MLARLGASDKFEAPPRLVDGCPSPTASEGAGNFVASMAKQQNISEAEVEKQFFETIRPTSLLKRFESTEEVASVVVFVASTQAVAINGAAVRAEGGVIRSIF